MKSPRRAQQSTSLCAPLTPQPSDITDLSSLVLIFAARMDTSTLQPRDAGPGPYPDVTKIPTPPLQRAALFIIFFFPALSTVVVGLRLYTRVTMRTLGVGMWCICDAAFLPVCFRSDDMLIPLPQDDWLCTLALVRHCNSHTIKMTNCPGDMLIYDIGLLHSRIVKFIHV